jgi:TatD DNase family protein
VNWIDTHAHLDDPQFQGDLPAVLERAQAAGVVRILTLGVTAATSVRCLELARQYPFLAAAVGLQPNQVAQAQPGDWEQIVRLASAPEVVALGETGLDRYRQDTPFSLQEEYFRRHLALARQLGKPVVIHCRQAEAEVLRVLREEAERQGPVPGVMHSFTGDIQAAQACLDLGLYLSFAGMVTFKNAAPLREVARHVPWERLLLETDSPYLAPVPRRGQRNEPAFLVHTAACLAAVRGVDLATVAQHTCQNARTLFRL